jgi:hypothetical protein
MDVVQCAVLVGLPPLSSGLLELRRSVRLSAWTGCLRGVDHGWRMSWSFTFKLTDESRADELR